MNRIVLLLVLCYHALSQPVTDEPSSRHTRELIECCPCPGSRNAGDQDILAGSQLARAAGVDDCPCRARGADSEGASSMFFPSAGGPFMRPNDSKEDAKNLLEPEVALATSMLDTLREATELEYQEALARDAARSAAESSDAVPEESASNVVIIVNPRDTDNDNDFVSEATHVQESRCIHPLGTPLGKMRSSSNPISLLAEPLSFPKLKRPSLTQKNLLHMNDGDLGASNVEKRVMDINGITPKLQTRTPLLKMTTPLKSFEDGRNDAYNLRKAGSEFGQLNENESSVLEGLRFPLASKLKPRKDKISNNDLSPAPSNVQVRSELADDKTNQLFRYAKLPLNLRNLLKLRDVELIPKSIRKPINRPKLDVSKFAIPHLLKSNQNENNIKVNCGENVKSDGIQDKQKTSSDPVQNAIRPFNQLNEGASSKLNEHILNDSEIEVAESESENVDTFPSPSQVQLSIMASDIERKIESSETLEKPSDCNFMESEELTTTSKSYLEETREVSEEIAFDRPVNANVFEDEISNDNNEQRLEVHDDALTQGFDCDSETDSSNKNNISALVPLGTQERVLAKNQITYENDLSNVPCDLNTDSIPNAEEEIILENQAQTLNDKKVVPHIKAMPSLSKTLTSIRENVVKTLDNLKKPELFKLQNAKNSVTEGNDEEQNISDASKDQYFENDETDLHPAGTTVSIANEKMSDISMNDLQGMSDKLLDTNLKVKSESSSNAAECESKSVDDHFNSNEVGSEIDNDPLESSSDPTNIENYQITNINTDDMKENACIINNENKNTKKSNEETLKPTSQEMELKKVKEMETGASDTVINTLPGLLDSFNSNLRLRTPLFEDIIVQSPSGPLNLLGKPLGEVLNLNPNIPTLDDLRNRLANIFNTDYKSAEDYSSSLENDSTNDAPVEEMAPEASTINSHIKLPSLKQLEDLNVDIFQDKPLTTTLNSGLPKAPRLNLNSYRAKVPVPSNLELKQVKTESKLGRNRGRVEIDRPSFIIGSERKEAVRKFKPSNTLANPLDSLPLLEELRNHLRSNTKNLLSSPEHLDLNLFPENLRSNNVDDIAETIRLNTQKTMKGLQQKMRTSLKKTKINSPFGDSFTNPQELFEDVNDKLKAIHYDLNDRLASIHDDIIDPSRFKCFDLPRKSTNRNVMTNLKQNKAGRPSRLQTSASTISTQEIDPHRNDFQQRDFILGKAARNNFNPVWNNSPKIPIAAESASSPSIGDVTRTANLPSQSHFQNIPSLNRNPTNLADIERPAFRSVSPFKAQRQPNKVTISFGTTTAKPVLSVQPDLTRRLSMPSLQNDVHRPNISLWKNKTPVNHKLKSAGDTRVASTQFKRLRTPASLSSSHNEEFEDTLSLEESPKLNSNLKASVLRETPISNTQYVPNNFNRPKIPNVFADRREEIMSASKSSAKPSVWPKVTENSFLSKVRDAVNTRASSFDSKTFKDAKTESKPEMLRSASENSNIVFDEPLKENVSYKCKMVCTKEYR